MEVARTVADLRSLLDVPGRSVGFVPTMGALHEGHLALFRACVQQADVSIASIFVNPLQFGPGEDLDSYPRDEARDLSLAGDAGIDVVFAPHPEEIYPAGATVTVRVGDLGSIVEGEARPGHFDGVATVVAKLLNIARPDYILFGQKDAQQVAVIQRLVTDLRFDTEVVVCPTVRDPDGLALSSRNAYLSAPERARATILWTALRAGREALQSGQSFQEAERAMHAVLATDDGIAIDYASAVDPATFEPASAGQTTLLVLAARVGRTRLIDNLIVPSPIERES